MNMWTYLSKFDITDVLDRAQIRALGVTGPETFEDTIKSIREGAETAIIAHTDLTPEHIQESLKPALRANPRCKHIFFFNNQLKPATFQSVSDLIAENDTLRMLAWMNNVISPFYVPDVDAPPTSWVSIIADALKSNNHLSHFLLDLTLSVSEEDAGFEYFFNALKENSSIRKLWLSTQQGPISESCGLALSQLLKGNKAITHLFLGDLQSSNTGGTLVHAAAESLHENDTLMVLTLDFNTPDDENILGKFADSLAANKTLLELQMRRVNGHLGVESLAETLSSKNTTLMELILQENGMTQEDGDILVESLDENHSLLHFHLYGNNMSHDATEKAAAICRRNEMTLKRKIAKAVVDGGMAPWNRSKLMVIGQGRAGKTATVRALQGQSFVPDLESTIGASLTETHIRIEGAKWNEPRKDSGHNYAVDLAARFLQLSSKVNLKDVERDERTSETNPISDSSGRQSGRSAVFGVTIESGESRGEPAQANGTAGNSTASNKPVIKFSGLDDDNPFKHDLLIRSRTDKDALRFSIWDYGGQKVFYTLHHLFLTRFGVYLLIFNMNELLLKTEESVDYLKFWLNSKKIHAPSAPLFLAGTFLDKLESKDDIATVNSILAKLVAEFMFVRNESDGLYFFPLSNQDDTGVGLLRSEIEHVTRRQEYVNRAVSLQWMQCLDSMLTRAKEMDVSWLKLQSVRKLGKEAGIKSLSEIDVMLELFHELGVLVHLTATANLKDIIVTNAQWLVDSISKVIRDGEIHRYSDKEEAEIENAGIMDDVNRLFKNALASRDLFDYFWDRDAVEFLLDLMRRTLLMGDWKFGNEKDLYLIPSMLTDVDPNGWSNTQLDEKKLYQCWFEPSIGFLPIGVFERLICLAIAHSANTFDSTENIKEPILRKNFNRVWFGPDCEVILESKHGSDSQADMIMMSLDNPERAQRVFTVIVSMLQKVTADFTVNSFDWNIFVDSDAESRERIPLRVARKRKTKPWFSEKKKKRKN